MDAAETTGPISFDVDEWDENFINEVFQAELGLSSRNAASANPAVPPPSENPSYSYHGDLYCPGFDAGGSDDCFSPPRELSQRFPEKSDAALVADECVTVETRILRNAGYARLGGGGGGGRKNKEIERLKKELEHLTKKFTHMEQHCITLKKDTDQKSDQLKFAISQLEAKDAEIYSLKTEYLGTSKQNQPHASVSFENKGLFTNHVEAYSSKMQGVQTDGYAVSELKRHMLIDDSLGVGTSCDDQECPFPKRNTKRIIRAIGIQTDVGLDGIDVIQQRRMLNEHEILSNLHATWGCKKSGNTMVSKLFTTCSADFCVLFGWIDMSSKSNLDGEENKIFSDMDLHDATFSSQSSDAAKASRFYQLVMKMRYEMVSLQAIIYQLLELCSLDDGTVAHASLRILHTTLQHHLCLWPSSHARSNVFVGPFNGKKITAGGDIKQEAKIPQFNGLQMTDTENQVFPIFDSENLRLGENQDSSSIMFLHFESLVDIFEVMQKIVSRKVEEYIRLEGLSIMSLIIMESKPNSVREKFCSVNVLQTLSTLMSEEAGFHVRKQAVRLLFLLLNSPKMMQMVCGEQANVVDHAEVDDTQRSIATWQREICCMLENLAGCLTVRKSDTQELKLRRCVIILLAFVASSGKAGFEVLLTSVTLQKVNFLDLIIQMLAFEMDAEIPDNGATQDWCKERISLIREALILLNRLASHPTYSVTTLRVLTGSKATTTLTVDVANRLLRRLQCWLKHYHGTKKTQVSAEINDLARFFRLRVFTFLGVPIL